MPTAPLYRDSWINPRLKLAALWTSMLVVFAYVDLFSLYRADIRADLEAGTLAGFTVGEGFLVAVTAYVIVPALMIPLSLVLPARLVRTSNVVVALLYLATVVAGAVGEWAYFLLGSAVEVALLGAIVVISRTWPTEAALALPAEPTPELTRHQ